MGKIRRILTDRYMILRIPERYLLQNFSSPMHGSPAFNFCGLTFGSTGVCTGLVSHVELLEDIRGIIEWGKVNGMHVRIAGDFHA
jgi:hypothetical protein